MSRKVNKTDAEWQAELSPEQFHVCRLKGTEPAFTGRYWDNHEKGIYRCACCGEPLFDLYPLVTIALARIVLGELLSALRRMGGLVALGGAALVAAG